uniref:Ig-like domain-containing protein n=1 Tax=Sparus aurata TaxID=8175 RepID=A0A671UUT0_SPAAU
MSLTLKQRYGKSYVFVLNQTANRAKAELRADDRDIPVGGSVTLTCSVNPSSSGWKYFWYRGEKTSEPLTSQLSAGPIRVSEGGVYWCRGGRGEPVNYTEYSDSVTVYKIIPNKAVVTLQPNWTEVYRGERITLRCEIRDGGDTEWEYDWRTTSSEKPSDQNEHRITSVTGSHSGDYRCKGRKKHTQHSATDWSDPIKLTVSYKPWPVLTVSPSWLSAAASVTLNCRVKDPSAGWRFYWYKMVPDPSDKSESFAFRLEMLPGSSSGTEQDSYIVHGRTLTAGYSCRAGRGDPVYYSEYSYSRYTWSSDIHSSASLTVSPDSAQHFTSDSVSLSCEGNSTEWRVRRSSPEGRDWSVCSYWGTMNGSTCNINTDRTSDAVYWCQSGSGESTNAVNITVQDGDMILLSPARPVTEGHSVSLSCKLRSQTFDSIVFFYHNEKVIQSDSRWELNISEVSKSDEGFYKCQHSGRESAQSWMSVQANRPKAELRADDRDIPVGGSVTLTCSVNPSSSGWKYFWYRGEKTSEPLTSQLSAGPVRVSEEGVYWCRGGRGEPVNYTEYSDSVTIYKIIPNKAVVTLQPNWTEVYRGERITLRCEIKDGGDTEWEYEWRTTSSEKPSDQNEHSISSVTGSHSGDYRCKGRKKHTQHSSTDWSDPIKLTVSDKLRPVITVSPSWLSAGASVTLNCSVKDPSAGWRFYWYKRVPISSGNFYTYSYGLLLGSSSGTEQDFYIVHGQTHTAEYMCRAGRGDPEYYSYYSDFKFVWSADIHSSASLTVSPDRAQHFTSDSVSLSCEGNSTKWRVMRSSPKERYPFDCSTWGTMTGSTCNINTDRTSDAVYWCQSGSGEFSNAVNITVQGGDMILLSPARPVTEGHSVSLSCKLRSQTFDSTVFFYHNEKVIQNDSRWELKISAVSKSDEGFYKCQHSGRESAQSWMSVQGE